MATMYSHQAPAILLGTGNWGEGGQISTPEQAQSCLDILKSHNLINVDTSRNYPAGGTPGSAELLLGTVKAVSQGFILDSKADNYHPGDHKYDNILASVDKELSALQTDKLRIEYIHWPDRTVPLTEPLRAMNEKYKQGKFDRFGISNYSAPEVEQIMEICEKEGYIKPTVFQCQYSALCRRGEKQLFPLLRKHGFSIFAWSPAAMGTIKKDSKILVRKDNWAGMVRSFYGDNKTDGIQKLAEENGITGYELCIRWVMHHSQLDGAKGDGVILGVTRPEQLEDTLSRIVKKGPLEDGVVKKMEEIWEAFEADAPSFSPWVGKDGVTQVM